MARQDAGALEAIRGEIRDQYTSAVLWRVVEPCVLAQIDALRDRVLRSGAQVSPVPVYSDDVYRTFVLRMPDQSFEDGAWRRANADGVASRLPGKLRWELDTLYSTVRDLNAYSFQNRIAQDRLLILGQPVPLDPALRGALLRDLDELGGRLAYADLLMTQGFARWRAAGMLPPARIAWPEVQRSGTRRFCRAHGLPLRTLAMAAQAAD